MIECATESENVSPLGDALSGFEASLRRFREALQSDAPLHEAVFGGTEDWTNLLAYKLVPHLAGESCLIVAITGGTNTGKSTVFNLLLGRAVSPVMATAAATARPLLAANGRRAKECLEGKFVPEFAPRALEQAESVVERETPANTLFVARADTLPDCLALFDTPDVDSIEREHWEVADNIRAAGDVLVAVLTGEKYKDDRVIGYFRQAIASRRVVIPVMNKANPARDFEVARRQLAEFVELIGSDTPCFVIPHDFNASDKLDQPIHALDGETTLAAYLESLDVPSIKRRVYQGTVAHLTERAGAFLEHAAGVGAVLRSALNELEARALAAAAKYDPAPGSAVGGMFHEYVQRKRGLIFRWIGSGGKLVVQGASVVGRTITGAFRKRARLEANPTEQTDAELHATHAKSIERIVRELLAEAIAFSHNLREPAAHLVEAPLESTDADAAARDVIRRTLSSENVSEEFRQHAYRTLDAWWSDHKGKRRILEALDGILAVTPAAIAAPISLHTGGVGVAETMIVVGPVVEQFMARVIEYQFGDALFDFLSPWRKEQQEALYRALCAHLLSPGLDSLEEYLDVLEGDPLNELRSWHEQCRKA